MEQRLEIYVMSYQLNSLDYVVSSFVTLVFKVTFKNLHFQILTIEDH